MSSLLCRPPCKLSECACLAMLSGSGSMSTHDRRCPNRRSAVGSYLPDSQSRSPDRCLACGELLAPQPGVAACPHCGFAADGSMLVLHGWASRHLRGSRLWWICLKTVLFCSVAALLVQDLFRRYMALLPAYPVALGICLAVFLPLAWRRRWPLVQTVGPCRWQVRLSPAGFAARLDPGPVEWKPWSPGTSVRFDRVRPDLYRLRISPAPKVHMIACDWAKMDFDSDIDTNRRILERVAQWRQAAVQAAGAAAAGRSP